MADRRAQIEQAFLAAAACEDAGARERAIAEACGGDAELMAEVRSLLGGHEAAAGGVLDKRNVGLPPSLAWSKTMGQGVAEAGLPSGTRVGGFTLMRMIGAGGMGVVYVAEQERPRRTVAIKLIRSGMLGLGSSGNVLRRFEVEADILGRLHHPGIAQIYEAGSALVEAPAGTPEAGMAQARQPFLAMELIDGPTITEYAEKAGLGTRERLELLAQVCDAVEHAHQRGVIHRDLKPSNILVDSGGGRQTPQIKVLDFGVARVTDADLRVTTLQTSVGQLIGTLPYMSPEQVAGDPEAIDTRSDVYALGVLLYQLLTGKLPHDFSSRSIPEAARIIRDESPLPPSRLGGTSRITAALRGDIDTIVAKAIEKDKERRYPSARELGEDLRRHLAGEPIAAKRDSVGYVLQKKLRRYRALVVLGAAALVAVGTLGVFAGLAAVKNRKLAGDLSLQLSDSKIERARLLSRTEQAGIAESMIWEELLKHPESKLAKWALWDVYMRSPCLASIPNFKQSSFDCAFSPDGRTCAIANRMGGKVEIWDAGLQRLIHTLDLQTERAFTLGYTPDGAVLATGGTNGVLRLWNTRTGELNAEIEAHKGWIEVLSVSRDGKIIATSTKEGELKLWSGDGWREARSLVGHTDGVHDIAFSPDGKRLATASKDRTVRVWDIESVECAAVLDVKRGGHTFDVSAVAFSPDGKTLATGSYDHTMKLWDVPGYTCRATVEDVPGYPAKILYNADGTRMYVSGDGIQTHDARDGRVLNTLMFHEANRRTIALSPDGKRLLATSSRGRISLWETEPEMARVELPAEGWPCQIAFSPDGKSLAVNGGRGTTRLYTVGEWNAPRTVLPNAGGLVLSTGYSPDGTLLATGTRGGNLVLWRASDGEKLAQVEAHVRKPTPDNPETKVPITATSFSPDGTKVLTLAIDRRLKVWTAPDFDLVADIDVAVLGEPGRTGSVTGAVWSADGTRIAVGSGMPNLGVWRLDGPTLEAKVNIGTAQSAVAFSTEPNRMVIGADRAILWVDTRTGAFPRELVGHSQGVVGFSFMGSDLLLTASRDRSVRVWDWKSGLSLESLQVGTATPASQALSPDGRYIAVSLNTGGVLVWDLWYYNRHVAGSAEWNLNRLDPATVTPEARARVMEELKRLPGVEGGG